MESDVAAREAETPGFASHAPGPLLSSDRAAALSSMIELPDAQADVDIVSTTSRDPILGEPAFWSAEAKVDAPLEEITREHTWRLEPLPPQEEAARLLGGLEGGLEISPRIEIEPERDNGSPASMERQATEHLFQAAKLEPIEFAMNGSPSDVADDAANFSDDDPAQAPLPPEAVREPGPHVDLAAYDNSAMAGSALGDASANGTPEPHAESIESGGSSSADLSTMSSAPLIASESLVARDFAAQPAVESAVEPSLELPSIPSAEPGVESRLSLHADPVAESVAMNFGLLSASEFPAERDVAAAPVVEPAAEPSLQPAPTPAAEPELESGLSLHAEPIAEPIAESVAEFVAEFVATNSALLSASEFPAECEVAAAPAAEPAAEPSLESVPTPPAEPELGSDMPLVHERTNLSVTESAAPHDLQAQSQLETVAVGAAALESEAYEPTPATPPVASETAADAAPSASPMAVADAPSPAPQPPTEHISIHDSPDASLDTSAVNDSSHQEQLVSAPHETAPPDADEGDHPLGKEVWASLSAPLVMPSVSHADAALLGSAPSVTVALATNLSPDALCDTKTIEPASATEATSASEESAVPLIDQMSDPGATVAQFQATPHTAPAVQHDADLAPAILDVPTPRTLLTAEELESIVTRIVDRMQPKIVDSLNRQILRPLIEALVHRELRKH
jgi:hypothetical protein